MKVHFIAIGGSAMHNLALALRHKGYTITGSDDEINEPSRTRLENAGILPKELGWFPEKINDKLDAIILGMHARADNPELLKASALGLNIYSYPEYLYEQSKNKKRVVIGGSHGKTSITAMLMHVLKYCKMDFDYMVGAQLEGFETMVKLTDSASFMILEGDEYLSSPIDRRPKFHLYKPDIALLSGIAWDHINVFPTFENYVEQFRIFIDQVPPGGAVVYCKEDALVKDICEKVKATVKKLPYGILPNEIVDGITYVIHNNHKIPLMVFGEHNLMNINGARLLANQLGVSDDDFFQAISTFKGAAKRLEKIAGNDKLIIYKDFAHSPSKLKATTEAVKMQFKRWNIIACMELHTFSSLNESFLSEFEGAMDAADEAIVYFNPKTIAHKKLNPITPEQVKAAFKRTDLVVYTDAAALKKYLKQKNYTKHVLLIMTSGNFDGINLNEFAMELQKSTELTSKVNN